MMKIDHSLTYTKRDPKHVPHKIRLRRLFDIIDREMAGRDAAALTYADFGCSNGYLTNLFSNRYRFGETAGFDHNADNLEAGRAYYPDIRFERFDLGVRSPGLEQYDVITCLETVEHVGDLSAAIDNLTSRLRPGGGVLILTVPIEIGFWGLFKFLVKRFVYRYRLDELDGVTTGRYLRALVSGRRISRFRRRRQSWGTHFGFDYRDLDDLLQERGAAVAAYNKFTTRYYLIRSGTPA
jgi:2-polyprenyl-3-methyl-5-hydroxy-6-metoxy-1,4-benzoquinol methylase